MERVDRSKATRRAGRSGSLNQAGFTLIELLVVIVILGIISAVVVFAVRGAGDKAEVNARATDVRTLRTAQEAFCARFGRYAENQEELVNPSSSGNAEWGTKGFLSEKSTLNNIRKAIDPEPKPCNETGYVIEPIGDIVTDQDPPLTCGQPGGWCVTNAGTSLGVRFEGLVQLESGKVFKMSDGDTPGQLKATLYDPNEDTWSDGPNIAVNGGGAAVQLLSDDPNTIGVSECASADGSIDNCGKVLVLAGGKFGFSLNNNIFGTWWLYDPEFGSAGSFERLDVPHHPRYASQTSSVQITGSDCGARCVNILITGEVTGGGSNQTNNIPFAELFDPKTKKFSLTDSSYAPLDGDYIRMAPLRDGRVLMINDVRGINNGGLSLAKLFNPMTGQITDASPPGFFISGGSFGTKRANRLTVLNDGKVLAVGESAAGIYTAVPEAEGRGSWEGVSSCASSGESCFVLAPLADGSVLARNSDNKNFTFDRETKSWPPTGMNNDPRSAGEGVLIDGQRGGCGTNCNKVLAVGEKLIPPENNVRVPLAELYCGPQAATC